MFIAPSVSIKRRKLKNLPKRMPEGGTVKVGFPAGKVSGDILNRAAWNHFGTRGGASGGGWGGPIPARPFLLQAMRQNKGKYRAALKGSAAQILVGSTDTRSFLAKLGTDAQGDVQEAITNLSSPPNSPVTVALKGSSNPLIDSGAMRGAVTYEVKV